MLQELPDGKSITNSQIDPGADLPVYLRRDPRIYQIDRRENIGGPRAACARVCSIFTGNTNDTVRGTKSSVKEEETTTGEEEEGSDSGRRGARARSDRK